ncbi:MAG: carboxy terminal-processing peptidase [Lentisphaeria bacterium]|nr:carboxy terminal-processing peptidase [Lentisphaeria bacterium]
MKKLGSVLKDFLHKYYDLLLVFILGYAFVAFSGSYSSDAEAASDKRTEVPLVYSQAIKDDLDNKRVRYITKTVINMLNERHYRPQKLNAELSAKVFDEYLKMFDPLKMYFTAQDINSFSSHRENLINELRRGDAEFAFKVYEVYLKRMREYRDFAENLLKQEFDFSVDESFVFDRADSEYAADEAELKEIWRKKLKNDVLTMKLYDRIVAEEFSDEEKNSKEQQIQKLWSKKTPQEKVLTRLKDLDNVFRQRNKIDVLGDYLTAVSLVFGPHSSYMSPREDEDFDIHMSLSLIGIGATLTSEDGFIRVVDIVPGGPADLDGRLKVDDRIIGVAQGDGEVVDVIDMSVSNAVKLIRGEEDTIVKLTVIPGERGRNGKPEVYAIKRAKVALEESAAKGIVREVSVPTNADKKLKVGVITIPSFYMDFDALSRGDANYRSVSKDVAKILKEFKQQKIDTLVIDLRNNGGGSLYEAIELSGLFVKKAPVVQIRNRAGMLDIRSDENSKQLYDGPMVILTNKFSASASEIFSGAMRDLKRAIVVGDSRTYGKGTVLEVIALNELFSIIPINFSTGSLKFESSVFYRISGSSVQQLGIEADVVIPSYTENLEVGEMFNDYHLPWDEIKKCRYQVYYNNFDKVLAQVQNSANKRISESAEFAEIKKQSETIIKNREVKEVSLNEEKRYAEYQAEKKTLDAEKNATSEKKQSTAKDNDIILDEAVNIAVDFAEFLQK